VSHSTDDSILLRSKLFLFFAIISLLFQKVKGTYIDLNCDFYSSPIVESLDFYTYRAKVEE